MMIDASAITVEALNADPYPIYDDLRKTAPIVYVPQIDEWLVTSWDDCRAIGALKDSVQLAPGHPVDKEFFGGPSVLTMSGEKHRGLREGIDQSLKAGPVARFLDDGGRDTVIRYIDAIAPLGRGDLSVDLFNKISVRVVGNRLGFDDVADDTLVEWFEALSGGLSNKDGENDASNRAAITLQEIDAYMADKIAHLRAKPDETLLSHMLHAGLQGGEGPRTFDEVMPSIRVIILGAFQEPGHSVATTFWGLLNEPEQLRELQDSPDEFAPAALRESFRWIAPIGVVAAHPLSDFTYEGVTVPAGAPLSLVVAAANRDPAKFDDAHRYDMHRERTVNATFGYGVHHCSGHQLAKGLGEIMVEETARRLPNLRLDPASPATVSGYLFRGAKSLPVLWG
jgi:cytochrome P450